MTRKHKHHVQDHNHDHGVDDDGGDDDENAG